MAQHEASEALKEKLGKAESMGDVVRAFSEEGIEVSAEQLDAILKQVANVNGEIREEAMKKINACKSAKEAALVFEAEGIEFPASILNEYYSQPIKAQNQELSEEALDLVAGGGVYGLLAAAGACVIAGPIGYVILRANGFSKKDARTITALGCVGTLTYGALSPV